MRLALLDNTRLRYASIFLVGMLSNFYGPSLLIFPVHSADPLTPDQTVIAFKDGARPQRDSSPQEGAEYGSASRNAAEVTFGG